MPPLSSTTMHHEIVIIGGGVVGLAILKQLTCITKIASQSILLVEAEKHLVAHASGHNSGIACTGVDAPLFSLERALVRDSISLMRHHNKMFNLPSRPVGSLVCDWGEGEEGRLEGILEHSLMAGDCDDEILTAEEALALEPNINKSIRSALHIKNEVVIDPWLIPISYASHAVENGAVIKKNWRVKGASFDGEAWTLTSSLGEEITATYVISATGNHGDSTFSLLSSSPAPFTNKPRKGQYTVFKKTSLLTRPLQPIPTSRTKGVFVFSSLYGNVVAGPTAEDVEEREAATTDAATLTMLKDTGIKCVPELEKAEIAGSYAGLRPATTERDYQFHVDALRNFLSVASIRSTGLTASHGIGRHAASLMTSVFGIKGEEGREVKVTPFPDVEEMMKEYRERGDGMVEIPILGECFVTHPITQIGWGGKLMEY